MTFSIYLILMFLACSFGAIRFSRFNRADKILYALLFATFCIESLGCIYFSRSAQEIQTFLYLAPIQLLFVSMYYTETVAILKRRQLGLWIGFAGVSMSTASAFIANPADTSEPVAVFIGGFLIVMLSLVSFYAIFTTDEFQVLRAMQFWSTATLSVFWTFSWCYFSLTAIFRDVFEVTSILYTVFLSINLITYASFTLLFVYYPKMIRSGE